MSILIKGMDMPIDREIILRIDEKGEVYIYGVYPTTLYQAVELPPHGDLIDRDTILYGSNRLIQNYYGDVFGRRNYATDDEIRQAPAIIEAERGEHEF